MMDGNLAKEEGYIEYREFDNGRNAAIMPFIFTWAIISDLSPIGYEDRWCYASLQQALEALSDWDGHGEPKGWHRHPKTGRRVDDQGSTHINP